MNHEIDENYHEETFKCLERIARLTEGINYIRHYPESLHQKQMYTIYYT